MKTIRVKVTAKHIEKGEPIVMHSCPVALALHECGFPKADVGDDFIYPIGTFERDNQSIKSPPAVKRFVNLFDVGKPVKPFAFTLRIP